MKQFMNIFKYELTSYFKNKMFIGTTIAMILILGIALSFPRIVSIFENDSEDSKPTQIEDTLYLVDNYNDPADMTVELFKEAFPNYKVELVTMTEDEVHKAVEDEVCESGIIIEDAKAYTYIGKSISIGDNTRNIVDQLLQSIYQTNILTQNDFTSEEISNFYDTNIASNVIDVGKDQGKTFFYTYFILFLLYMTILMYGTLVATNVASEKSSRAMEMLITSARPTNLLFGKILGSGTAGLIQVVIFLGSSMGFYRLNESYWSQGGYDIVQTIFDVPFSLLIYTVIFFILGFFIYAFLYGAIGSWASKVEDVNTSAVFIQIIFIAVFFMGINAMTSGTVDSSFMKVATYIPLSSPIVMPIRISMGQVSNIEIMASIAILIASNVVLGILCAKIYRIGVLLYGTAPTPKNIIKALRHK